MATFFISVYYAQKALVLTRLDLESAIQRNKGNIERCLSKTGLSPSVLFFEMNGSGTSMGMDVRAVVDDRLFSPSVGHPLRDQITSSALRLSIIAPEANGCGWRNISQAAIGV